MKILITTIPFGEASSKPIDLLEKNEIEYLINPFGRKIKEEELREIIVDYDAIIAGTEVINSNVLRSANKLKLISRVGSGVNNIDINFAKSKNIIICYTPNAPTKAVSEFTIGLMLSLLRGIHKSNIENHRLEWIKTIGRSLLDTNIGILGLGRIGSEVSKALLQLGAKNIYFYDSLIKESGNKKIIYKEKEEIFKISDLITCHLPLNIDTSNFIDKKLLSLMKKNSFIINTSRGGIINEKHLFLMLKNQHLAGAAVDVFEQEPYFSELCSLDNCIITSHMASLTERARIEMEISAVQEVINLKNKIDLINQYK